MRRNVVSCILDVTSVPRVMPERWALQKFLTNGRLPVREQWGPLHTSKEDTVEGRDRAGGS